MSSSSCMCPPGKVKTWKAFLVNRLPIQLRNFPGLSQVREHSVSCSVRLHYRTAGWWKVRCRPSLVASASTVSRLVQFHLASKSPWTPRTRSSCLSFATPAVLCNSSHDIQLLMSEGLKLDARIGIWSGLWRLSSFFAYIRPLVFIFVTHLDLSIRKRHCCPN